MDSGNYIQQCLDGIGCDEKTSYNIVGIVDCGELLAW